MKKPKRRVLKRRNPIASTLRHPLFRQRTVPSTKSYKRRDRNGGTQEGDG